MHKKFLITCFVLLNNIAMKVLTFIYNKNYMSYKFNILLTAFDFVSIINMPKVRYRYLILLNMFVCFDIHNCILS